MFYGSFRHVVEAFIIPTINLFTRVLGGVPWCLWHVCDYYNRKNQGFNFAGGLLSKRDYVKAPVQFRRIAPTQHLKRLLFMNYRSNQFHIISTTVIQKIK